MSPELDVRRKAALIKHRSDVLADGGVLSVYLHYADKGENGLEGLAMTQLKETVKMFKSKGGKIAHLYELKGYGKGYWKE